MQEGPTCQALSRSSSVAQNERIRIPPFHLDYSFHCSRRSLCQINQCHVQPLFTPYNLSWPRANDPVFPSKLPGLAGWYHRLVPKSSRGRRVPHKGEAPSLQTRISALHHAMPHVPLTCRPTILITMEQDLLLLKSLVTFLYSCAATSWTPNSNLCFVHSS